MGAPVAYSLDLAALDVGGSYGLALRSGRLVATVVSRKTGKHVSVRISAKRKEGRRFRLCAAGDAERLCLDTPNPEGRGREVGCLHLSGRWVGRILPPWGEEFDAARLWAVRRVLDIAQGLVATEDEKAEILQGRECLVCGRELTDPESITRDIGPECWRKVTGLEAASGEHQKPGEQLQVGEVMEALHGDGTGASGEAHTHTTRPDEATVIANDKRHADIEKIEVEERVAYEEATVRYEARRAEGKVQDPAEFAADVLRPDVREQIESELQQATQPEGEFADEGLASEADGDGELVPLRSGEDAREVLSRLGNGTL